MTLPPSRMYQGLTAAALASATSRESSRRKPTALPASSACFHVRMSCGHHGRGMGRGAGWELVGWSAGGWMGGEWAALGGATACWCGCTCRAAGRGGGGALKRGVGSAPSCRSGPPCRPAPCGRPAHRQAVADDDLVHAGHVAGVGGVVPRGRHPLVPAGAGARCSGPAAVGERGGRACGLRAAARPDRRPHRPAPQAPAQPQPGAHVMKMAPGFSTRYTSPYTWCGVV